MYVGKDITTILKGERTFCYIPEEDISNCDQRIELHSNIHGWREIPHTIMVIY